ncbi:MAG: hypothetical protein ACOX7N_02045 [Lawsonibacter sp.]|jgi:hypothetical protein
MPKHENPNIEIINGNLWTVRFALIPLIPQISYKPDPEVPLVDLPGGLTPDGLMILNKDFKFYDKLLKITQNVMKMKDRVIRKEIIEMGKAPANNVVHVLYQYSLKAELERRRVKKEHRKMRLKGGVA